MDFRVGIVNRNAQPPEQIQCDGLPHADGAGQADDPHQSFLSAMP